MSNLPASTAAHLDPRPQMQPAIMRHHKTPEDLEKAVQVYFDGTEKPTWSGLALHLGLDSRTTLWNYLSGESKTIEGLPAEEKRAWLEPLKRGASRIEEKHEGRLYDSQCAGAIFALKQRGWTDTQEVSHRHDGPGILLNIGLPTQTDVLIEDETE